MQLSTPCYCEPTAYSANVATQHPTALKASVPIWKKEFYGSSATTDMYQGHVEGGHTDDSDRPAGAWKANKEWDNGRRMEPTES